MNERIQELAKQAGYNYIPSSNSGPLQVEYLTPELEKFAELIVRECMKVCQLTSIREDDGQTFVYSDAIQEHFRS